MKKILNLVIILSLFVLACSKTNNKIYLDDIFYGKTEFIDVSSSKINKLENSKSNYVLYTYNNFCNMKIPCEDIFKNYMNNNNISFYSIPFSSFKETYLHNTVKFAPSIIIVENGKIIDFLDANSDNDYNKYQNVEKFSNWINKYIYLEKE